MKPADETLTNNDDLPHDDYSLVLVPSCPHPLPVPYCSTVAVDLGIYLIGEHYKAPPSSAVHILDCRTHMWRYGRSMLVARAGAKSVFLDEKIYVMGGCGEDESMTWMEVYDIKTQTWRPLPSHGAAEFRSEWFMINVLEGKIYANSETKDYAYDPKEGTWEVVETHSCLGSLRSWCVIEDVMYSFINSGYFKWYDSESENGEMSRVRI